MGSDIPGKKAIKKPPKNHWYLTLVIGTMFKANQNSNKKK